jgi:diguanylate cyclase (GGDEF)-like protein
MLALDVLNTGTAIWALVAAAVLGPIVAVMLAIREKQRLATRLGNLEDVLRRMRASDPGTQFDDRPAESSLQLSRERLMLTNLLDRFPEVTKEFVVVENVEELGRCMLAAFERILDVSYGVAFIREGSSLRLIAHSGLQEGEWYPGMTLPMGAGRIGYAAAKCLVLRPDEFGSLDATNREHVEKTIAFQRDFDFYIPMVHRGRALGCIAVGGVKKVVNKAHTVCMALSNLGALVATNIQRADEIRALSRTDPLTKLANRRHFYELLDGRLATRAARPFAVFLLDIDHFKRINDEHGHAVGDNVLVRVAEQAQRFVRTSDDEFACRFGGEEFVCVLNCDDLPSLTARLEMFRHGIARVSVNADGNDETPVRISGGVSFCPAEREDADSLIRLADDRLYAAKDAGRDRIFLELAPHSVVEQ